MRHSARLDYRFLKVASNYDKHWLVEEFMILNIEFYKRIKLTSGFINIQINWTKNVSKVKRLD